MTPHVTSGNLTPSAEDKAEAERFVAETYDADPTICRIWLANMRAHLVRLAAVAAMQKRQNAEWKAQTRRKWRDAA